MAKIIGNIKPEDDYTHPLGPEQNFNESVYFNFFDRIEVALFASAIAPTKVMPR